MCGTSFSMAMTVKPCSEWNISRKANLSTVVQREWLYGYLSGWSEALKLQTGQDIYRFLPVSEEIVSRLNSYCELHPQNSVNDAALELFNRVLDDQLMIKNEPALNR